MAAPPAASDPSPAPAGRPRDLSRNVSPYRGMFDPPPLPDGPDGGFRERIRRAEGELGLRDGSGELAAGLTAGVRGSVGTEGSIGRLRASGAAYGTGTADASGQYHAGEDGVRAEGRAGLRAGFGLRGDVEARSAGLAVPGVSDPLDIGGRIDADGFAGVSRHLQGRLAADRRGVSASGSAGGFIGAEGSLGGTMNLGPLSASGRAFGMAGAGAGIGGEFSMRDGHLRIGGSARAALGLGTGFSAGIDLNYRQLGEMGRAGLRGLGQLAGSGFAGARSLAGSGLNAVGRGLSNPGTTWEMGMPM